MQHLLREVFERCADGCPSRRRPRGSVQFRDQSQGTYNTAKSAMCHLMHSIGCSSQGEAADSLTIAGRCGGLTTLVLSLAEHSLDRQ